MKKQLITSLITIGLAGAAQLYASPSSKASRQGPVTSFWPPTPHPDSGDPPLVGFWPPTPHPDSGDPPLVAFWPPTPHPDSGDPPLVG
jgi:hypothetical protein